MSNAKKCDRCGQLYEERYTKIPYANITVVDREVQNQRDYMDLGRLDLCEECNKLFFKWLKEVGE